MVYSSCVCIGMVIAKHTVTNGHDMVSMSQVVDENRAIAMFVHAAARKAAWAH